MKRAALITASLFGLLGIAVQFSLVANTFIAVPPEDTDAAAIWFQAGRIRDDARLYEPVPGYGPHYMAYEFSADARPYPIHNSPYLPLLSSITSLLPRTSLPTFQRAWSVILLLAFLGFATVLARIAAGRFDVVRMIAAVGLLHVTPGALDAMRYGNVEPLLWFAFAWAVADRRVTGALLVMMTMTKPYAVWPLLFAGARCRSVRRSALVGLGATTVLCVAAIGPVDLVRAAWDWVRIVPAMLGQGSFAADNYSLSFAALRLARAAGIWDYQSGPITDAWPRVWLLVASIGIPLAVGYATRRLDPRMQVSLVMLAALLAAPLCWRFYLVVGWVPVALWLENRRTATARAGC